MTSLEKNMQAAGSFEMLVTTYQTTRCHNQEDHNANLRRRENLKPHTAIFMTLVAIGLCSYFAYLFL
jgi:hypothetical protein